MKTKEFIRRIEELGFEYKKAAEVYFIYDKEGTKYASACHTTSNQISNTERAWDCIDKDVQEKLFDLLIEYAKTPVKDRMEEKKFHLKHRWLNLDTDNYLHLDVDDGSCMLDDNEEFSFTKIKLTKKEIEEIKEKFNTDLADFELVEVVEEIER